MATDSKSFLECVFCNKKFTFKGDLQEHFREHGTSHLVPTPQPVKLREAIRCDFCMEEFDSVSRAICHKFKKHRNVSKVHYCQWCGQQFAITYTYKLHLESHKNDSKPTVTFLCTYCSIDFYSEDALSKHYRSNHEQEIFNRTVNIPPPSKKVYISANSFVHSVYFCHICGQRYVIKFNLQKHIKSVHGDINEQPPPNDIIKCNRCEAFFCNEKAYNYHNAFHKDNDIYVISEEMRSNVITQIDQDFDYRRIRTRLPDKNDRFLKLYYKKQKDISDNVGNMNSFSPPPSDDSDSDNDNKIDLKSMKNSSKDLINLNKSIKTQEKNLIKNEILSDTENDDDNLINLNKSIEKQYEISLKTERSYTENEDDFLNLNKSLKQGEISIKIEISSDTENEEVLSIVKNYEVNELSKQNSISEKNNIIKQELGVTVDYEETNLNNQISVIDDKNENDFIEKSFIKSKVKYITKEEIKKLKKKGLIRVAGTSKSDDNPQNMDIIKLNEKKPRFITNNMEYIAKNANPLLTEGINKKSILLNKHLFINRPLKKPRRKPRINLDNTQIKKFIEVVNETNGEELINKKIVKFKKSIEIKKCTVLLRKKKNETVFK